ncbi:MAG: phosphatase PAP2 family protein [Rhodobacteraceae bacterium]|nr:phosphatase PAP2 family protein [Paracoccaceae bacterium]
MPPLDYRIAASTLVALSLAALAAFALFPHLDLAVSGWFYRPGEGFWLASSEAIQFLRHAIWNLSILVFTFSLAAMIAAALRRPLLGIEGREAAFVFLLYLLGPILLVNGILKTYWGRARPVDVTEFGGAAHFTPPWMPATECVANCSFVSGEGSAATALALAFLIFAPAAWRLLPRRGFALYALAGVVLPAIGLALRVMTGRHFLSDTIFAMLFVLAIALALHRLLLRGR